MDDRFNSNDWDQLTPAQRINHCRVMAEESRKLSTGASPELQRIYLELANQWSALASELEKTAVSSKN